MSRSKNTTSPFYATALHKMPAGHKRATIGFADLLHRSGFTLIWPGSGWRPNSSEHSTGAMDWMVSNEGQIPTYSERQQALASIKFLISNHEALGIVGILFSTDGKSRTQAIGYSKPFSAGWRNLENRGSNSANHVDHFHVRYARSADWPIRFNRASLGATTPAPAKPAPAKPAPAKPAPAKPAPAKPSVPAFPNGIGYGKSSPSAIPLQRQLKKAGFMAASVKENANYGPKTKAAVIAFHNKNPKFKSSGKKDDGNIGPKGWAFLFSGR